MSKTKWLTVSVVLFVLFSSSVHALDLFGVSTVVDAFAKVMQGINVFYLDFLAIILDVFTILLFIIWMLLIAGIIYSIIWIVRLPQKMGVNSIQEAAMKVALMLWKFTQ